MVQVIDHGILFLIKSLGLLPRTAPCLLTVAGGQDLSLGPKEAVLGMTMLQVVNFPVFLQPEFHIKLMLINDEI